MQQLFREPLFYIFFAYGISFLLMSYFVAKGTAGSGSVPLIAPFNLLALFGLIHGITEMTDWVRFIRKTLGAPESAALVSLSQVCLIVSFVVLLQFAIDLFVAQSVNPGAKLLRGIPSAGIIVFAIVVIVRGMHDILAIGLLGRYTFGFASAALAAMALLITAQALSALGDRGLVVALYVAAGAFVAYAVFGGLMVKPIAGIPIQLFRSFCAVTIAASAFRMIRLSATVAGAPRELTAGLA